MKLFKNTKAQYFTDEKKVVVCKLQYEDRYSAEFPKTIGEEYFLTLASLQECINLNQKAIGIGKAVCSKDDVFDLKEGKRISLLRAKVDLMGKLKPILLNEEKATIEHLKKIIYAYYNLSDKQGDYKNKIKNTSDNEELVKVDTKYLANCDFIDECENILKERMKNAKANNNEIIKKIINE